MSFTIYNASAPMFIQGMNNMAAWLDKAAATGNEAALLKARLAPDMLPLPAQLQIASDSARNAMAKLAGIDSPSMPDTESSFAELKDRCRRTVDFVENVGRSALDDADSREVVLTFPNGMGYRLTGAEFLVGFALPNFFFHVTTAYAILRAQGLAIGKADFLQHLGPPNLGSA